MVLSICAKFILIGLALLVPSTGGSIIFKSPWLAIGTLIGGAIITVGVFQYIVGVC